MGKNFDQILEEARAIGPRALVDVTIATNQDNGIVSYATGTLGYFPRQRTTDPRHYFQEFLRSKSSEPLKYYFSDRMLNIDPKFTGRFFPPTPRQPFSANAHDKIEVYLSEDEAAGAPKGAVMMSITLLTWDNAKLNLNLERKGNLLVGLGPAIGNKTKNPAIYTVSFGVVGREAKL